MYKSDKTKFEMNEAENKTLEKNLGCDSRAESSSLSLRIFQRDKLHFLRYIHSTPSLFLKISKPLPL